MSFKTDIEIGDIIQYSDTGEILGVVTAITDTDIGLMFFYIDENGFGDFVDWRFTKDIERTGKKVDVVKFLSEIKKATNNT